MHSKSRICHQLKLVLLVWFNISLLWIIFIYVRHEVIETEIYILPKAQSIPTQI